MTARAEISISTGRQTAVLVLLVALLALPSLPTRELLPSDEPRFALVARQMTQDPAPLVPHLGYDALEKQGEVYADKPPLFFWLISLFSFLTGGVSEISARLPSFFAAIIAVLLTRRIGALLLDEGTGFMAGLVLATTSQFFQRAFWCSIDMVLTALVMAATYAWMCAARTPTDRRKLGLSALGGGLAAAAALSKGPVGVIFPLAFFAADRMFSRGAGEPPNPTGREADTTSAGAMVRAKALLAAGAAFALPIGAWMAATFVVGGPSYLVEILFKQNVTRYVAAWNNLAPWYYYLFRIPLGLFPWTFMLPAGIIAAWTGPRSRTNVLRGLLVACGLLFLFFSASPGKRGVYLLPIYPVLAIAIAAAWRRSFPSSTAWIGARLPAGPRGDARGSRAIRTFVWVHAVILCMVGLAAMLIVPAKARERVPDLGQEIWAMAVLLAAVSLLSLVFVIMKRPERSFAVLVGGVAVMMVAGSLLLVSGINQRAGVKAFGPQLAAVLHPGDFLVVDAEGYEQILFYSGTRGTRRNFNETRIALAGDGSLILEKKSAGERRRRKADPTRPSAHSSFEPSSSAAEPPSASREQPTADAIDRGQSVGLETEQTPSSASARPASRPRTFSEVERARRRVQFPPGARVVFVVKGANANRVRSSLGPSSRVILASTLYQEPYFVIANQDATVERRADGDDRSRRAEGQDRAIPDGVNRHAGSVERSGR